MQHAWRYTQLLKSLVDVKRRVAATKCCSHRWRPTKAGANLTQKDRVAAVIVENTLSGILPAHEGTSDRCGNLSQYIKYSVTHLLTTVSHMMHFPSRTISNKH